jgi:hypothetical protein
VDKCMDCYEDILEGESYYDIKGHIICEECIEEYKKEAEISD